MHVRIAWEIYNHQQKQKGDKKPGDNPALVPSTSSVASPLSSTSSSLSSKTPTLPLTKSSTSSSTTSSAITDSSGAGTIQVGQKRPASGAPPIDFLHKRPATDSAAAAAVHAEHLLRNQLFAPPRPPAPHPPPNPLDPLSSSILPRPPYLPPFGPSPLRECLSCHYLT